MRMSGNDATEHYVSELTRSGFGEIIASPYVQRLRHVSFLSTLDHVYKVDGPSSRFDHTVAVAYLALRLAEQLHLTKHQRQVLILTNLLHDVGHPPFSHNAEPFLVERRGVYHNGLLTVHLRSAPQDDLGLPSLSEILSKFAPDIVTSVTYLLRKQPCGDPQLDAIHFSEFNCDKVEGTARTLASLAMESVNPVQLLELFLRSETEIGVDRAHLGELLHFWRLQKQVYQERIYTSAVFACEAMLTRVLERLFASSHDVRRFVLSTDNDVFRVAARDPLSAQILEGILAGRYFLSVREHDVQLLCKYESALRASRFHSAARKEVEREIADDLGVDPETVVSHFSLRKQFGENLSLLFQTTLFTDPKLISLDCISKALYSFKVPGDFFDVYFAADLNTLT